MKEKKVIITIIELPVLATPALVTAGEVFPDVRVGGTGLAGISCPPPILAADCSGGATSGKNKTLESRLHQLAVALLLLLFFLFF